MLIQCQRAQVTNGEYNPLAMNGKEVYKFATGRVPEVVAEAMENAGVTADDVDWLLLHQANIRIMETVAKKLKIPMDKVRRAVATDSGG
jgi:3-oxoacyl-[acyl-carrier-protein] synthase III